MASLLEDIDEKSFTGLAATTMGLSLSVTQPAGKTIKVALDKHELEADTLTFSQTLNNHVTYKNLNQLYHHLDSFARDKRLDSKIVVHYIPTDAVKALMDDTEHSFRILPAEDKKFIIVTLPGRIHSIISAWMIGQFSIHHYIHQLNDIASVENDTHHAGPNKSSPGKVPDLIVRRLSCDEPSLIVEVGVSEKLPALRLDARWWISNISGVRVVLLIGYDDAGKYILFEKWTPISVERGTRSGIVRSAICEMTLGLKWEYNPESNAPNNFTILPGSSDPLLIGPASRILNDITIPPSKDYTISSGQVQELVERVYKSFLVG